MRNTLIRKVDADHIASQILDMVGVIKIVWRALYLGAVLTVAWAYAAAPVVLR